jgi:hypothetical protein
MENNKEQDQDELRNSNSSEKFENEKIGVQHDEKGNIIKNAENAVPPEAWKNQKKAYSDAFENNKNQQLGDDF